MEKRPEMDEEDEDDEDVIELWSPWKNKLLSCWSENTTDGRDYLQMSDHNAVKI